MPIVADDAPLTSVVYPRPGLRIPPPGQRTGLPIQRSTGVTADPEPRTAPRAPSPPVAPPDRPAPPPLEKKVEGRPGTVPVPATAPAPRQLPFPAVSEARQGGAACLAALIREGVPHRLALPTRGIDTPVLLTGPVGGVTYVPHWGHGEALLDCRFAQALALLGPILLSAGFDEVRFSSFYSYRHVAGTHRLSRHANGLAVDIHELRGPGGLRASVERDWKRHHGSPNACTPPFPDQPEGRLRRVVCGLEASGLVYLVLTPDSDAAHYNHLHVSGLRTGDRPLTDRVAGVRIK